MFVRKSTRVIVGTLLKWSTKLQAFILNLPEEKHQQVLNINCKLWDTFAISTDVKHPLIKVQYFLSRYACMSVNQASHSWCSARTTLGMRRLLCILASFGGGECYQCLHAHPSVFLCLLHTTCKQTHISMRTYTHKQKLKSWSSPTPPTLPSSGEEMKARHSARMAGRNEDMSDFLSSQWCCCTLLPALW